MGFYVQSLSKRQSQPKGPNFSEKHKHMANFYIWPQQQSYKFLTWSATGILPQKDSQHSDLYVSFHIQEALFLHK